MDYEGEYPCMDCILRGNCNTKYARNDDDNIEICDRLVLDVDILGKVLKNKRCPDCGGVEVETVSEYAVNLKTAWIRCSGCSTDFGINFLNYSYMARRDNRTNLGSTKRGNECKTSIYRVPFNYYVDFILVRRLRILNVGPGIMEKFGYTPDIYDDTDYIKESNLIGIIYTVR